MGACVDYHRRVATDARPPAPLTIDEIRRRLGSRPPLLRAVPPEQTRVRAAVAIVARQVARDVEILFIRRAAFENDPWSGDIAFPGGRIAGAAEDPRAAAERETLEEVGIDLARGQWLGQLDDVIGGGGAVVVSGFVYAVSAPIVVTPNHEVAAAGWVSVDTLSRPERRVRGTFRYKDRDLELPALRIFDDDSPYLWGLTYQFVERFMGLLEREFPAMPWRDSD
jgi:8-oxo-dGTP pyrophosphatase MutT (NUDIX family)